ncbi:MAG: class II D-tagatose-bisphosphate aldolase non-catalytic subunit [Chloroflexia bacterium]
MCTDWLDEVVRAQKRGEALGIPSICSAHPFVLQAVLRHAAKADRPALIESTGNQVNPGGGYTGMRPRDFVGLVQRLADGCGFPLDRLILGGDHLGPGVWRSEPAEQALGKAEQMVRAYVEAGYTKIHLDASVPLGDDAPERSLPHEVVAERTARLARAAEESLRSAPLASRQAGLRYVIGAEVPPAGGMAAEGRPLPVTTVESVAGTVATTHDAFLRYGLGSAWERVIAIVVQPGVEFGDEQVFDYAPERAEPLVRWIERQPRLVYEVHSTDFQTRTALARLVRDHFAILKVGPVLTWTLRRAAFALAMIERELVPPDSCSRLIEVLDQAMEREPSHWRAYYTGTPEEQARKRRYSLSDRIRYYWAQQDVQAAWQRLLSNLEQCAPLPLSLLGQYLPDAFRRVREGGLSPYPEEILYRALEEVLETYTAACYGCAVAP